MVGCRFEKKMSQVVGRTYGGKDTPRTGYGLYNLVRACSAMRRQRSVLSWAYVALSIIGFAVFLALGYHYTPSAQRLESLSFLITATDVIKWWFAFFLTVHAIVGGFVWFFLMQGAHAAVRYFIIVWIIAFEFYTGLVPCDTPDTESHFVFACLAFSGFIAAGVVSLVQEKNLLPDKSAWGQVAIGIIIISFVLLVTFAVLSYIDSVTTEGPCEWTAIFLLAWLPGVVWELRSPTLT